MVLGGRSTHPREPGIFRCSRHSFVRILDHFRIKPFQFFHVCSNNLWRADPGATVTKPRPSTSTRKSGSVAGGGGGGGPSIGIVEDRESISVRSGNTFDLGQPGIGGVSLGIPTSVEGNPGADGVRAEFAKLAGNAAPVMFVELVLPIKR